MRAADTQHGTLITGVQHLLAWSRRKPVKAALLDKIKAAQHYDEWLEAAQACE